jgi:hypothetical protein
MKFFFAIGESIAHLNVIVLNTASYYTSKGVTAFMKSGLSEMVGS